MREAHFLKLNNSKEYPHHCLFVDTETVEEIINKKKRIHKLNFGWCCYRRRGRNHTWGQEHWYRFQTIKQFWKIVDSLTQDKISLHLFAHNWAFDAPVLNTFEVLFNDKWQLKSAVIESPPIIIKYHKDKQTIKIIDTLNYYTIPLSKLGEHLNIHKLEMPTLTANKKVWDTYCKQDVIIIMEGMIAWFDFIRQHELGGFGPTLASQAMRAFRHRFMKHKILIDDDHLALKMARNAYHGGRTECFKIGEFEGPFYYLDVNSMYPFVMQKYDYPTELISVFTDVNKTELKTWLKKYCVIADVVVTTEQPVYSIIHDERLIFPVGTFEVTLTTRELIYALKHKHIKKINLVSIYKKARIFKSYVDYFYPLKQQAVREGNTTETMIIKLFLTNLYGKFGQRGRNYNFVCNVDTLDIDAYIEFDYQTHDIQHYRQFAGVLQSMSEESESRDSHPAIAAHVTADARMHMWDLYAQAGRINCWYSDTDSVIVNKTGYNKLKHLLHSDELGKLKLEKTIKIANIYGAKDYQFDDVIRIKGVKKKAKWLDKNTVQQEQWLGLKGLLQAGDLSAPVTMTVTKTLTRLYKKGIISQSGVVSPLRFPLDTT